LTEARSGRRALVAACTFGLVSVAPIPASAFDPRPDPDHYAVRTWDTRDGMPVAVVLAALQTRDGYIWAGTEEGLLRFDGVRFTTFNRKNTRAFDANYVRSLFEDPAGTLWVGTFGGGLLRYRDGDFTRAAGAAEIGSNDIRSIAGDARGAVYVATEDGGLARVDGAKPVVLGGPEIDAVSIDAAPDGALWVGTRSKGVARLRDGVWKHFTRKEGMSSETIHALHVMRDGAVMAGTKEGPVDRIVNDAVTTSRDGDGPPTEVYAMSEDAAGNLWMGTGDAGVRLWRNGRFRTYGTIDGVANEKVFSVFNDREGSVWAGTLRGFSRMKPAAFTTYDDRHAPDPGTVAWCVMEDGADGVWVGTQTSGAEWHRPSGVTRYTKKDGLDSDEVSTLEQDRKGNVWVGTLGGLNRIRDGKITQIGVKDGAPKGSTYALLVDRHDDLWIGSRGGGLGLLRDGVVSTFSASDVPIAHVNALVEDDAGTLWIGGDEGLGKLEGGKYVPMPSPSGDSVLVLYPQPGVMWMGLANNGLGRLAEGRLSVVSTREGLFGDTVYSIFEDAAENLWMSGNSGVFRVRKSDAVAVGSGAARSLVSTSYGREDGMRTFECNGGGTFAATRSKDGRLWFATTEGVAAVDPAHLPRNIVAPPVIIEEARANQLVVKDGQRLPPGTREFEFRYTAPSFVAPERVPFKYRLDGFDRDWVLAGARRAAFYTNLAPGKYTFRVIAANEEGIWNEAGARFAFSVAPRFNETPAFFIGVGLLAIAGVWGVTRLRVRQLKARADALEGRVRERTVELSQANKFLEAKDQRIRDDLLQAQAFQQRLLAQVPAGPTLRFAVAYEPAELVGGDVYDVCEIAPGRFRVFVADTTGHGVQASLRTMVLKTEYDRLKREGTPGALLAALNEALCAAFPSLELRCSAVCFDLVAGTSGAGAAQLHYANAAHPPIFHVSASGVADVYARSPFLGMMEGMEFDEIAIDVAPGDRLVAFTDGLPEQENDAGEGYGLPRLRAAIARPDLDASALVLSLVASMRAFSGTREAADDTTIVIAEVSLASRAGTS
jgi:ligand-binding sensor domain-containing protein/serine phosphatase RsbU (regulator of sigma subunit)